MIWLFPNIKNRKNKNKMRTFRIFKEKTAIFRINFLVDVRMNLI